MKALRWWPVVLTLLVVGFGAGVASTLQIHNADQLVNGFLFEDFHTFRGAIFPTEHTQLLKWPLFVLPHLFRFAPWLYVILTILLVLITTGALLYVLYVINRRTVVFGALCILLASVLLLVPAQAFDGGVTAPLSMAMLTGRNVEYVVYIAALALLVKMPRLRSWYFAGSTVLLSLLFVSDRLFLYFSLAGAALLGLTALVAGHKTLQRLARNWLAASVLAWLLSFGLQTVIGHVLVHVVSFPQHYERVSSLTGVRQGVGGTLHALALTFGLTTRAGYASLPAFALNLLTVGLVVYAAYWTIRRLYRQRRGSTQPPLALSFAAMLLSTSFVAIAGFACINQPYVQNARYLTITVFGGFVVLAVWLRTVHLKVSSAKIVQFAVVGETCLLLATIAVTVHTNTLRPKDRLAQRNQKIASTLQKHPVEYLVGNYWRVTPIRAATPGSHQALSPLQGCSQKMSVLTSEAWRPDLRTHRFAYLLTSQSLSVPQQVCSKRMMMWLYGQPTSEVIISGSPSNPRETLLFYDNGAAGVRQP